MFNNIGSKLKTTALIFFSIGVAASLIGTIVIWGQSSPYFPTFVPGMLVLVVGCLISWLGSSFGYAFGTLVEHTEKQTQMISLLMEEQKKANSLLLKKEE